MKIEPSKEALVYVYVSDEEVAASHDHSSGVIIDYDKNSEVVGVEILSAKCITICDELGNAL